MSVEDGIPEQGQAPQTHDWEKDYKALQAEYTRSQQALKDHEGTWEDEQALLGRIAEKYPHLMAEEDEETPEPDYEQEDDPVAPLRSDMQEFKTWQQQVEAERAEARFSNDLRNELGDSTVPDKATDWIKARTAALGNNPKALKQAVEEYQSIADELRGPARKSAPTPPPAGKAGEQKRDPRNREQRRALMAASIEANNQQ
jgi:hypothetical protein